PLSASKSSHGAGRRQPYPRVENAARPASPVPRRGAHDQAPLAAPLSDDDLVATINAELAETAESKQPWSHAELKSATGSVRLSPRTHWHAWLYFADTNSFAYCAAQRATFSWGP